MYHLQIIDEAQEELDKEIGYSYQRWGEIHAIRYAEELDIKIKDLQHYPRMYPLREDILPGIRILTYKGNRVVYILQEEKHRVVVLAVLSIYQPIDKNTLRQRIEDL